MSKGIYLTKCHERRVAPQATLRVLTEEAFAVASAGR